MKAVILIENLQKNFQLHLQGGVILPVLNKISLEVNPAECLALCGPSGSGKSTLLRLLYANYKAQEGSILIKHQGQWIDLARADLRKVLEIRKFTIGYVSQFLRVIPRVSTLEVVMEPLRQDGVSLPDVKRKAQELLARLNLPPKLWEISPTTFSGGEQQRINIARSFIKPYPILLLDEPTASLDTANRQVVVEMIQEKKQSGAAVVGIFHDEEIRRAVADRLLELELEEGERRWEKRF